MDLTSLSKALESTAVENSADASFNELLIQGLTSPDPITRESTVRGLEALVSEGNADVIASRQQLVFGDSVLDLLPSLISAHSAAPASVTSLITICLSVCSPREAILALSEALQEIEERFFGFVVSDDESEGPLEPDSADEEEMQREVPLQLKIVLRGLEQTFTRMPRIKSTPTLLTLSDALGPALARLSGVVSGSEVATAVGDASMGMIDAAWKWVQGSTDVGGEQRALLCQLFYLSTPLYGPESHDSLKRWYSGTFPKYAQIRSQSLQSPDTPALVPTHSLDRTLSTAALLSLDTPALLSNIAGDQVSARISPHASFASLILISHLLVQSACANPPTEQKDLDLSHDKLPPLQNILPLLLAALGSTAIDAGMTYLWGLVKDMQAGTIDSEPGSQIIELIFPLAARHPDPLIRLAVWQLVGEMIKKAVDVQTQIVLLRQLLEDRNPFLQIRLQTLVLLRQLLAIAVQQIAAGQHFKQTLLSPTIFDLPIIPSPSDLATITGDITVTSAPAKELLPQVSLLTEQLIILRYLSDIDEKDLTGVKSRQKETIRRDALEPARGLLDHLRQRCDAETKGHDDDVLHGLGLSFAVERLMEAVHELDNLVRK